MFRNKKSPKPDLVKKPEKAKVKIPHNCESVCRNYNRKIRAPKTVEGTFEKGDQISVCQLCQSHDHFKVK